MRRDRDRVKKRDSARAKAERKASRERLRGASRAEALKAGRDSFPAEFTAPAFDGDEPAPGLEVVDQKGGGAALVEDSKGTKVLLTSSTPLQARTRGGGFAPVDLSLREGTATFSTASSNADLQIAKDPERGVEFADAGFSIATQAGAPATQGVESDDRVYYQAVSEDTGFAVAPRPMGAELGWLIQSPAAPERFVLTVDLPAGGKLRRARTDNPIPGDPPRAIEIADAQGKGAGYVYPPLVYDTDGVPVASDFKIDGADRIVVDVEHRGKDLRFPLFADPEVIIPDLGGISGFPGWSGAQVPANAAQGNNYYGVARNDCAFYCNGLYLSMPTNTTYDRTGTSANWFYRAPPNTYLYRGLLGNMAHSPLVVFGFTFSRWFNGLLGPSNWEANVNYQNPSGALGPNPFGPASHAASGVVHDFCQLPRCNRTGGTEQSSLSMGLAAQNDVNTARISTGSLRATMTMGYSNVYLGDRRKPTMTSPKPPDRGWTDDTAAPVHTLGTTSASDLGLGMYGIRLAGAASGNGTLRPPACTGDPNRSSRCLPSFAAGGFSYRLNEGVSTLSLTPEDIVENQGTPHTWTERIDRTIPTIDLSGALLNREAIGSQTVSVTANSSDAVAGIQTSGVKSVELLVNGTNPDPSRYLKTCTGACATFAPTFDFDGAPYADGSAIEITLRVRDNAGHSDSSGVVALTIDKRAPDVDLRGPLAPAPEPFAQRPASTLTMTATDPGTLAAGVADATLRIDGTVADSLDADPASCTEEDPCVTEAVFDLEALAGSEQPPDEDGTVASDRPALAQGLHTFQLDVTDVAGNTTTRSWTSGVDNAAPRVTFDGALPALAGQQIPAGSYPITVNATDGDASRAEAGVRRIELSVGGQVVKAQDFPCRPHSCSGSLSYTYNTAEHGAGEKEILASVTDHADNELLDSFTVDAAPSPACPTPLTAPITGTVGSIGGLLPVGPLLPLLGPSIAEVEASINRLVPSVLATSESFLSAEVTLRPTVETLAGGFRSAGTISDSVIASDAGKGVRYGSGSTAFCLQPQDLNLDAGPAQRVRDSVGFVGIRPLSDLIERPTAFGSAGVLHLRGTEAPESFSWRVPLQPGQELRMVAPNTVALMTPEVLDPATTPPDGEQPTTDESPVEPEPGDDFVAGPDQSTTGGPEFEYQPAGSTTISPTDTHRTQRQFAVSQDDILGIGEREFATVYAMFRSGWARDATGATVPTTLTVSGDRLTLSVPHRTAGISYPVLADRTTTAYPDYAVVSPRAAMTRAKKGTPRCFAGGEATKPEFYSIVRVKTQVRPPRICSRKNSPRQANPSTIRTRMCLDRKGIREDGFTRFGDCTTGFATRGSFHTLQAQFHRSFCGLGQARYRGTGSFTVTFAGAGDKYSSRAKKSDDTRVVRCEESGRWTYNARNDPQERGTEKPADILERYLIRSGEEDPLPEISNGFAAHHIIPEADRKARQARAYGWRCGITPNRASNGIWLRNPGTKKQREGRPPASADTEGYRKLVRQDRRTGRTDAQRQYHQQVHTRAHFISVAREINREALGPGGTCQGRRDDALRALRNIKDQLRTGSAER